VGSWNLNERSTSKRSQNFRTWQSDTMKKYCLIITCARNHLTEHFSKLWDRGCRCGDSALNSLTAIDGHDRQYFYKLRAHIVSPWIFVRYERLMARKIAELFGLNHGVLPFYAACCFNELSRGSVSCLLNASFKDRFQKCHNSFCYVEVDDHGVRQGDSEQIIAQPHKMPKLI
jgi:hypothetical protein